MNFQLLEYNKSATSSIDEFSDLVQKTINENNDLLQFRTYENPHNGSIIVELTFGNDKSKLTEVMAFGPDRVERLFEQLNATVKIGEKQSKDIKFAGMVPMSKSNRSVCFIVLEKGAYKEESKSAVEQAEKTEQNPKTNKRTNRRAKNPA